MTINKMPRLLLIAGTGRNSGKTTFACQVIQRHCNTYPITAIKISSHFHKNVVSGTILVNRPDLYIAEETSQQSDKDSSLMLRAGAQNSYFVMAADTQLWEAFQFILTLIPQHNLVICESGGLRHFIIPGIFLVFHNLNNLQTKTHTQNLKALCDRFITFDGEKIDFDIAHLKISKVGWTIKKAL